MDFIVSYKLGWLLLNNLFWKTNLLNFKAWTLFFLNEADILENVYKIPLNIFIYCFWHDDIKNIG